MTGLIITGHERSGMSLVRRILEVDPQISMTGALNCYLCLNCSLQTHRRFIWDRLRKRRNNPFRFVDGPRRKKGIHLGSNLLFVMRYLQGLDADQSGLITADTVNVALKKAQQQPHMIGDKSADYWFHLDQLAENPYLTVIVVIRDPREVAGSAVFKARGIWSESWPDEMKDAAHVAKRWVRMAEAVLRHRQQLVLVVYEQLVTDPVTAAHRLAAALGRPDFNYDYGTVHQRSLGRFQQILSKEELTEVVAIAGDTMRELGYDPDVPDFRDGLPA